MVLFEAGYEKEVKVTDLWSRGSFYPDEDTSQDFTQPYDIFLNI